MTFYKANFGQSAGGGGGGGGSYTPNRVLISNNDGDSAASGVSASALNNLIGVTSPIQTQLNSKQASNTLLTEFSAASSTMSITEAGWIRGGSSTPENRWSFTTNGTGDLFINSAQNKPLYLRPNAGEKDQWSFDGTTHITSAKDNLSNNVLVLDQSRAALGSLLTLTNTVASAGVSALSIVGTTSTSYANAYFTNDSGTNFDIGVNPSGVTNANASYIWNETSNDMRFGTNNTERMVIKSTGDFLFDNDSGDFLSTFQSANGSKSTLLVTETGIPASDVYGAFFRYNGTSNLGLIGTVDGTTEHMHMQFSRSNTNTNVIGSLGVNTTSAPLKALHVEGEVLIDLYQQGAGASMSFRQNVSPDNLGFRIRGYRSPPSPDGLEICGYDSVGFKVRGADVAEFFKGADNNDGGLVVGRLAVGNVVPPQNGIHVGNAITCGFVDEIGKLSLDIHPESHIGVRAFTTPPITNPVAGFTKIYVKNNISEQHFCIAYEESGSIFTKHLQLEGSTTGTFARVPGFF